jgi:L-asparaginase II
MTQPWPVLFGFQRHHIDEIAIHGEAVFQTGAGQYLGLTIDRPLVMRSLLKPWQAMAIGFGGAKTPQRIALSSASHSGQPEHLHELEAWARDLGISEDQLRCPVSMPMDASQKPQHKRKFFHPCAAKHLAMLAIAKAKGWSLDDYLSIDHPVQKQIQNLVAAKAGQVSEWMADSCGAPVLSLTITKQLSLWRDLVLGHEVLAQKLVDAWSSYPLMVGGSGRFDSRIMAEFPGKFLAKEGADGLLVVQSIERQGTAFIKLAAGYNDKHLALALAGLLRGAEKTSAHFKLLSEYLHSFVSQYVPEGQRVFYRE